MASFQLDDEPKHYHVKMFVSPFPSIKIWLLRVPGHTVLFCCDHWKADHLRLGRYETLLQPMQLHLLEPIMQARKKRLHSIQLAGS